jgi:hypothetical protein
VLPLKSNTKNLSNDSFIVGEVICNVLVDVFPEAVMLFTLYKSLPPSPRSFTISLPPSTKRYCVWSSA